MNMSHKKLIDCLRFCPASDYYGATKATINTKTVSMKSARDRVMELSKITFPGQFMSVIDEREAFLENGSIQSFRLAESNRGPALLGAANQIIEEEKKKEAQPELGANEAQDEEVYSASDFFTIACPEQAVPFLSKH